MNTPPAPPQPQAPQISIDDQIAELITHKRRWDAIEKELKDLRDGMKVSGRIKQADKAMMILHLESGHDTLHVIQANYPQYLAQGGVFYEESAQKKGCLGIIMLAMIPVEAIAGWFMHSL